MSVRNFLGISKKAKSEKPSENSKNVSEKDTNTPEKKPNDDPDQELDANPDNEPESKDQPVTDSDESKEDEKELKDDDKPATNIPGEANNDSELIIPTKDEAIVKFIAFFKQVPESNWTLFNQMFVSQEQAIKKLDIMSNPNEVHIIKVEFPE